MVWRSSEGLNKFSDSLLVLTQFKSVFVLEVLSLLDIKLISFVAVIFIVYTEKGVRILPKTEGNSTLPVALTENGYKSFYSLKKW